MLRRWELLAAVIVTAATAVAEATWCIARSGASSGQLQAALDYACSSGADCAPIQANGLCYLPNTLPAHASYAFNSYYMRSNMAPGSCDFNGAATVSITDPSYGSCTYPSSPSNAGGSAVGNSPGINTPTTPAFGGGVGGLTPGFGPPTVPDVESSSAYHLRSPFHVCVIIFCSLLLQ